MNKPPEPAPDLAHLKSLWVPIRVACERTRLSRSTLLRKVTEPRNQIRHFLLRSHPDKQSGTMRIHILDLMAYFDREAEKAGQVRASLQEEAL